MPQLVVFQGLSVLSACARLLPSIFNRACLMLWVGREQRVSATAAWRAHRGTTMDPGGLLGYGCICAGLRNFRGYATDWRLSGWVRVCSPGPWCPSQAVGDSVPSPILDVLVWRRLVSLGGGAQQGIIAGACQCCDTLVHQSRYCLVAEVRRGSGNRTCLSGS